MKIQEKGKAWVSFSLKKQAHSTQMQNLTLFSHHSPLPSTLQSIVTLSYAHFTRDKAIKAGKTDKNCKATWFGLMKEKETS